MINADIKDLEQLVKNLNESAADAVPKTVRATLDREAFIAHEKYKENVHKNFEKIPYKMGKFYTVLQYDVQKNIADVRNHTSVLI